MHSSACSGTFSDSYIYKFPLSDRFMFDSSFFLFLVYKVFLTPVTHISSEDGISRQMGRIAMFHVTDVHAHV